MSLSRIAMDPLVSFSSLVPHTPHCSAEYGGNDCPAGTVRTPQSITIRGAGEGLTGYCVVATMEIASKFAVTLDGSTGPADDPQPANRASSARRVRVTVDPVTKANARLVVYYSEDSTDAGLKVAINTSLPAAIASETTFKWGLAASSGGETDYKGAKRKRCLHCPRFIPVYILSPLPVLATLLQRPQSFFCTCPPLPAYPVRLSLCRCVGLAGPQLADRATR